MALSRLFNSLKSSNLISLFSGKTGNNSGATLADINNVVDQWNINNSVVTTYAKYASGVNSGGPYQRLEGFYIVNGFVSTSNPALPLGKNSLCDCTSVTCKNIGGGIDYGATGCWKIFLAPGRSTWGCVSCQDIWHDIQDGTMGLYQSKVISLPPLVDSSEGTPNSPASVTVEVLNLPLLTFANLIEDPTNGATGLNKWHLVLFKINDATGIPTPDYTDIADITFKITALYNKQEPGNPSLFA